MTRTGLTHRLRRVAAIAAVTALATGALAACSSDTTESGDEGTKTLKILSSWLTDNVQGDTFNVLKAQFEQETGITLEVEENGTDLSNRFETTSVAGEEADVVILNYSGVATGYLSEGLVVDVSSYIEDWGLRDTITQGGIDFWTEHDDLGAVTGTAGFPYQGFNWPIWYNTAAFQKAGISTIPTTVDELLADIPLLRAAGIQPFALGGGEWPVTNFITWLGQQYLSPEEAGQIFSKGGWAGSANAVKGLDLFAQLRDAGLFIDNVQGYTADQMTAAYAAGNVAMMPSGSWAYTFLGSKGNADEIAVRDATVLGGFPVPTGGHYSKPTAFNGHNVGFFISPNGEEHIDAVEKFIKFMYKPETAQYWVTEGQQIMDVQPAILGDATADEPLVVLGGKLEGNVDWLLLPDTYIPSTVNYQPEGTLFIGSGESGADLASKLDQLYADAGVS